VLSVESGAKVRIIFKSANILIFFSRINRIFAVH
jgi:DNA mismatch repair protein MutS2